ncbi:MAG: ATP-binding protein [Actinoplanes sp.]
MTVIADLRTSTAVVTVCGAWGRVLNRDTFLGLQSCFGKHPAGLVLDLRELADPHAASMSTWLTARRVGDAMEPRVRVVACVPDGAVLADRLHRLGAVGDLPVFATLPQAEIALLTGLPRVERFLRHLPADPDTPALARNLVTEACGAWHLPGVLYPARLVMSELAGNAVEHAGGGAIVVAAECRGDAVHLIVADRDPRLPRLVEWPATPPGRIWESRGQGLRTVRAAAAAWGALPTADGKLVWATVRPG